MKRLLLLGGGHAHLQVLKSLGETPLPDVKVTLVSPHARQVYSGMLPGWVAGHYNIEQCVVPLAPLCAAAHVNFIETAATHIDLARRAVQGANGAEMAFDVLSVDTGPEANTTAIPGAGEHATAVRPLESFIHAYSRISADVVARAAAGKQTQIVFVGAGAAGVELALSMQYALRTLRSTFTLVSAANTLPGSVGPRLLRIMRERGFQLYPAKAAALIEAGQVTLQDGTVIPADHVVVSTGAVAATWPAISGLKTDPGGFILVNDHLQSISHPEVFAAGDCATMVNYTRPKSGVYAVRAGPPLAENLRRCLLGQDLVAHIPQERSLYLISTGDRYAIGSWGSVTWEGRWVWRWKDWIDRSFVKKYLMPPIKL